MLRRKLLNKELRHNMDNVCLRVPSTSNYFHKPFWMRFYELECELNRKLNSVVSEMRSYNMYVYNPTEYASELHCAYLKKYVNSNKTVMFVGLNPGPNGMVQNGVPFGNIATVRDWMCLEGYIGTPDNQHKKRLVKGFNCPVEEPSGQRLWKLFYEISGNLENFSKQCLVHNYCPLAFFDEFGRNITPNLLKGSNGKKINSNCLEYLKREIDMLSCKIVVAIGTYVHMKLTYLQKIEEMDSDVKVLHLPHPSPRIVNNMNWSENAKKIFSSNNLLKYF